MMKMKDFSIQFGLSFALISGCLMIPAQQVQAQVASDSDITSDVSDMAPGLLPTIKLAIRRDNITIFILVTSDIISQLQEGTYFDQETVPLELQQRLAAVLTDSTSEDTEAIVEALVSEGISQDQASELASILEDFLSDVGELMSSLSESETSKQRSQNWIASTVTPPEALRSQAENEPPNFQDDLSLRIDAASKLDKTIKNYNQWLASLDLETLQNPPASLQMIRQVLLEASDATKSGDE